MTKAELVEQLRGHKGRYHWWEEGDGSLTLVDLHVNEATNFTEDALARLSWGQIRKHAAQGRDIDHITRVTGYFSRVRGWNESKVAELRDRYRTPIT